jgi:hypothetical protein
VALIELETDTASITVKLKTSQAVFILQYLIIIFVKQKGGKKEKTNRLINNIYVNMVFTILRIRRSIK